MAQNAADVSHILPVTTTPTTTTTSTSPSSQASATTPSMPAPSDSPQSVPSTAESAPLPVEHPPNEQHQQSQQTTASSAMQQHPRVQNAATHHHPRGIEGPPAEVTEPHPHNPHHPLLNQHHHLQQQQTQSQLIHPASAPQQESTLRQFAQPPHSVDPAMFQYSSPHQPVYPHRYFPTHPANFFSQVPPYYPQPPLPYMPQSPIFRGPPTQPPSSSASFSSAQQQNRRQPQRYPSYTHQYGRSTAHHQSQQQAIPSNPPVYHHMQTPTPLPQNIHEQYARGTPLPDPRDLSNSRVDNFSNHLAAHRPHDPAAQYAHQFQLPFNTYHVTYSSPGYGYGPPRQGYPGVMNGGPAGFSNFAGPGLGTPGSTVSRRSRERHVPSNGSGTNIHLAAGSSGDTSRFQSFQDHRSPSHGSIVGNTNGISEEQNNKAGALDASATEAVSHGDPVTLALLLSSWANSLSEALAADHNSSSDALAFEAVFASSNALEIVNRHIMFRASGDTTELGYSHNGAASSNFGAEGTTVQTFSTIQKSLTSLNSIVLYGGDTVHNGLVGLANSSQRPSEKTISIFLGYLRALRSIADDIRAINGSDPEYDGSSMTASGMAPSSTEDVCQVRPSSFHSADKNQLMQPWRLAITRLQSEIASLVVLNDALNELPSLLPRPAVNQRFSHHSDGSPIVAESSDTSMTGNGRSASTKVGKSAESGGPNDGASALESFESLISADDMAFLDKTYKIVRDYLEADIAGRVVQMRKSSWPALFHIAGVTIFQSLSVEAVQYLTRLRELSSRMDEQLKTIGSATESPAKTKSDVSQEYSALLEDVCSLLDVHSRAVAFSQASINLVHVILSSLRAVALASKEAGVAPQSEDMIYLNNNLIAALSDLDELREWPFDELSEKIARCIRHAAKPRQRTLRFEEPEVNGETTEHVQYTSHPGTDAECVNILPSPETPSAAKIPRHRPRHARMKSSPDELLNLDMRLNSSDDEEDYLSSVDPDHRRPSPVPNTLGTPSPVKRLVFSTEPTGSACIVTDASDVDAINVELTALETGLSMLPVDENTRPAKVPERELQSVENEDDDDDGMIVHEDGTENSPGATELLGSRTGTVRSIRKNSASNLSGMSGGKPPVGVRGASFETDPTYAALLHGGKGKTGIGPPTTCEHGDSRGEHRPPIMGIDGMPETNMSTGGSQGIAGSPLKQNSIVVDQAKNGNGQYHGTAKSPAAPRTPQPTSANAHMRSMSVDNIGPF